MRIVRNLWPWAAAALSGALLVLCFAPFDQSWLAWIALSPLLAAIWFGPVHERHPLLRKAELGYLAGLVFFLGSLSWLTTVSVPGWFVLCLYLAIYPALWAAIVFLVATPRESADTARSVWVSSWRNLLTGITAAAAWVALEHLRARVFTGFGWNSLGVALHGNIPIIQITSFAGVASLGFLCALASAIAVATVRRLMVEARGGKIRAHFDFTLTLALIVGVFVFGLRMLGGSEGKSTALRVAAIQPSIPQDVKWNPAFEEHILETLSRLTDAAAAMAPDLLVWPEAATPRGFFEDRIVNEFVKEQAEKGAFALLFGTLILSHEADYNAAVMLGGGNAEPQVYPKSHLVMFGEYVPFRESFPLFAIIVGNLVPADFDAGAGPVIFRLQKPAVALAPLICFEDTVAHLAGEAAMLGARCFVNVTNDGWFKRTAASRQHLANAVFRCAENRRPMIRCANTGVTCVIDRFGRVQQTLQTPEGDSFAEGVMLAEVQVPEDPALTFYARHGDWFSGGCLAFTFAVLAARIVRRRGASA
ncbi:MAG: apolipoprotein N-acyltransferase [Chthoniobacterales bacterium]|nr:apolipoprotein N-acyltransferase [Chthoniobacterales bacterium]